MQPKKPDLIGLRVRRDTVQTAVHDYRHPSGRMITVVGTQHTGPPDYYAELRKVIEEAEGRGAVVHYEKVRVDDAAARTDAERQAVQAIKARQDSELAVINRLGLGWIVQSKGLAPAPAWVNVDVAEIDVVRLLGPGAAPERIRGLPSVGALVRRLNIRLLNRGLSRIESYGSPWKRRVLLQQYCSIFCYDVRQRRRGISGGPLRASVLGMWREYVAVTTALAEQRDLVMVWGAGHLEGIGEILLRNGFELADTRWFTAMPKP